MLSEWHKEELKTLLHFIVFEHTSVLTNKWWILTTRAIWLSRPSLKYGVVSSVSFIIYFYFIQLRLWPELPWVVCAFYFRVLSRYHKHYSANTARRGEFVPFVWTFLEAVMVVCETALYVWDQQPLSRGAFEEKKCKSKLWEQFYFFILLNWLHLLILSFPHQSTVYL